MSEPMLVVTVDDVDADVAADRLWQLGVRGVVETTVGGGRIELSTSVGDDRAVERAVATLDPTWEWRVDEVDSVPAQTWRDHVAPTWFREDMVCLPAWIDVDVDDDDRIGRARLATRIDPGAAFGLGDHPTTRLSMAAIADLIVDGRPPRRVLDVGCGSGALGVLAAQLGAGECVGIDLADAAVAATLHNARLNGVGDRVDASTRQIGHVDGRFDLVVANILAPVLVSLAPDLQRLLADDGTLVVSGILADRHRHVLDALAPLRPVDTRVLGGWAAVVLRP